MRTKIMKSVQISSNFDLYDFSSKSLNCLDELTGILNLTSDNRKELQTDPFRSFTKDIIPFIYHLYNLFVP